MKAARLGDRSASHPTPLQQMERGHLEDDEGIARASTITP